MTAARAIRACAAGALALLAALTTGTGAHAAYEDAISLSWDGTTYTSVTSESFLGAPVTVPGDSASRTVLVRNDGPTAGVLRASIVNVGRLDPDAPDVHHEPEHRDPDGSGAPTGDPYLGAGDQGNFYDDLVVRWPGGSATFTELDAAGTTEVLEVELAKGEEVPLTLSYELPVDATSGNKANVEPRLATFDVVFEIGGDLPPGPTPTPTPTPTPPNPSPPSTPSTPGERLAQTGAQVGLLAGVAALAIGAGAAVVRARRAGAGGRQPD